MKYYQQTSLFQESSSVLNSDDFMLSVLAAGADLAISISGGKDSDAMLRYLMQLRQKHRWPGETFALFCELGRIEWAGVDEHLRKLCSEMTIPLIKLYPNRPMIEEWDKRYQTILSKEEEKPHWSSASVRYCTDRQKTAPSNKFFRGSYAIATPAWSSSSARFCTKHEKTQPADKLLRGSNFVVCAMGLRGEESSARAKKPRYQVRNDIASKPYKTPAECKTAEQKEDWAKQAYQNWLDSGRKGRFALSWHPIHEWSVEEVWRQNGTSTADVARRVALYQSGKIEQAISGFPGHWVYITGNTRLSCSMCVLGSTNDILNGAMHNPWTWLELSLMELLSGWGFQQGRWLASMSHEVLSVSMQERRQLHQTLYELGLLEPMNSAFALELLCCCGLEQLQFWTDEAFIKVAQLIAEYWKAKAASE